MADKEIGQIEFASQVRQKVQYLRLNRNVERRHRFVEDDNARLRRQRAGNPDPLGLTAGKLMWIPVQKFLAQVHTGENLGDPLAPLGDGHVVQQLERRFHDLTNGLARIQRRNRVLKHILDAFAELCRVGVVERCAFDLDMSR